MTLTKLYINLICGLIPGKQKRKAVRQILRGIEHQNYQYDEKETLSNKNDNEEILQKNK